MAGPSQWQTTFYVHQQTFNHTTPISLTCNFSNDSFTKQRHKIYAFTLSTLLCFLQVQTSGNTTSPFQVHPATTKASVFGILCYYLAFRAWLCWPLYATQLSFAMALFGSFSLASLVSLLFSDSWWCIKYVVYVLLVVVELHQMEINVAMETMGRQLSTTGFAIDIHGFDSGQCIIVEACIFD
ncbi:hypothetical protein CR513_31300, partial [Mucuna pruriens]